MPKQNKRLKSTRKAVEARVANIIRRAALVHTYAQDLNEASLSDMDQRHLLFVLDNANHAIDTAFDFFEHYRNGRQNLATLVTEKKP